MKINTTQSNIELPSIGKLVKSTVLAICIAGILLITVVLPAEYGIDPTGLGRLIGLSRMGEIKVSLAEEASAAKADGELDASATDGSLRPPSESKAVEVSELSGTSAHTDEITVSLTPNEGKEIKLAMVKGEQVDYVWWTDGGRANFDLHADSKKLKIKYHNYGKGAEVRSEGVLEAAFDGKHGWFWRNRTAENMTVTLQLAGSYSTIHRPE